MASIVILSFFQFEVYRLIAKGKIDMFLIAGVQPKTKTLDKEAGICSGCGLKTAHTQRIDHYFSLFFIPLLRVKKGLPMLTCDRCSQALNVIPDHRCRHCNEAMDPAFKFCPFCGEPAK